LNGIGSCYRPDTDQIATLVRASQRWRRIRITDAERTHLLRLRQDLGLPLHRASALMKHSTTKRFKKRRFPYRLSRARVKDAG